MTEFDLRLNRHFYENIDLFKKKSNRYFSKVKRSRTFLKNATKMSKNDILDKFSTLSKKPSPKEAIFLIRNLLNSGVWIGQSSIRYLLSFVDFTNRGDIAELSPKQHSILKRVSQGQPIDDANTEEIFKTIYNEVEYSHYYPDHKSLVQAENLDCTLVLIPGVFNELFCTAAFERAAMHLSEKYNIKYFAPKVNGFKSCAHNAGLIKKQIFARTKKDPNEKFWFICYSKGGLDTLHFLKDNVDFANSNILGVSTIASPLLGSDHLNSKILKVMNSVHGVSENRLNKLFKKDVDLFAKDLRDSISSTFQRPWLRNNHLNLPENIFYTAIGFESQWYDSHIWMILAKGLLKSNMRNDGVVDAENSLFPYYFNKGINLGIVRGHHLVGTRSSFFCQEALLESLIIFLKYRKLVS